MPFGPEMRKLIGKVVNLFLNFQKYIISLYLLLYRIKHNVEIFYFVIFIFLTSFVITIKRVNKCLL